MTDIRTTLREALGLLAEAWEHVESNGPLDDWRASRPAEAAWFDAAMRMVESPAVDRDHGDEDDGAGGCTGMRAVRDALKRLDPVAAFDAGFTLLGSAAQPVE